MAEISAAAAAQDRWQHQAYRALGRILDWSFPSNPLPAARWTVEAVGCQVTGEFRQQDQAARRAAFHAWATLLGLRVAPVPDATGGERLHATGQDPEDPDVRVMLVARLWPAEPRVIELPDLEGGGSGEDR